MPPLLPHPAPPLRFLPLELCGCTLSMAWIAGPGALSKTPTVLPLPSEEAVEEWSEEAREGCWGGPKQVPGQSAKAAFVAPFTQQRGKSMAKREPFMTVPGQTMGFCWGKQQHLPSWPPHLFQGRAGH